MTFFTLDEEFLMQYAIDSGDFVSNSAVVEDLIEQENGMGLLGGQDPLPVLDEAGKTTHAQNKTEYDDTLLDYWIRYVLNPYMYGEKTLDEAIEDFVTIFSEAYPEFPNYQLPSLLSLALVQGNYREDFHPLENTRYFIMPIEPQSQAEVITHLYNAEEGQLNISINGDCVEYANGMLSPIKSGQAILSVWLTDDENEEIENTRITANILVFDPDKTIILPSSINWIESEALSGTNAECLIIKSDLRVIERNAFANCPNLHTVILLGDHSKLRTSTIFSSSSTMLFISNDGKFPTGFNAEHTGISLYPGN